MFDQIEITQSQARDSIPVLNLKGRLDASGAQQLREMCHGLQDEGHSQIIIDLAGVEFVASSGLGTFLLLTEEYRENGGKVIFAAPSTAVLDVVTLLNLDQFLFLEESVEVALRVLEV
jgi:anti-sigma B factor antagonist